MWQLFAPLWRTFSGGRGAPAPRAESALPLESHWGWLLAKLELPPAALRDVFTSGSLEPHFHYRRFHRPKKGGGRREISEPDARLKRLQHEIIRAYFAIEQTHPAAVAYQLGKSTADHVWEHAGAEVIVIADIQDFFPNTRADRIEEWWRLRVDDGTARLLTILTTDRGGLPQGAPTSPGLSNFVNYELDTRLAQRAAIAGARYTRYCDDLAFSWPFGYGPPAGFDASVCAVLHEYGYALHPTKGWQVYDRRDEPEVTGVVLTRGGGVRLPERIHQAMRKLARSRDPRDLHRLQGYMGYEKMLRRMPTGRKRKAKGSRPVAPVPPAPPAPPPRSFEQRRDAFPPAGGNDEIPF